MSRRPGHDLGTGDAERREPSAGAAASAVASPLHDRLLIAFSAALWLPFVVKALRRLHEDNDFTVLWLASRSLLAGEPLYGPESAYMYPPFLAWVLLPLAVFPATWAGFVWLAAKIPLFYWSASTLLSGTALSPASRRRLVLLSPLLVFRCLDSDLVTGNANVYILAGVAFTYQRLHLHGILRPGLALASVSAIKLSPAYIALALGSAGRGLFCATFLAILLVLLVVPAFLSPDGVMGAWGGFVHTSEAVFGVESAEEDPGTGYLPGQSLRPILHRHLRPIDATAHDDRVVRIHLVDWPAGAVEWIYRVVAALLGLAGLLACRNRDLRWVVATSAVILLLISPYSRKAHFMLLLPAMLLLVETSLLTRPRPRVAVTCLAAGWILTQLSTRALWGRAGAALLLAHGAVGMGAMAILVGMWIIRRRNHVRGLR